MESYRALGNHIVNLICSRGSGPDAAEFGPQQLTLEAFFGQAETYLKSWLATSGA